MLPINLCGDLGVLNVEGYTNEGVRTKFQTVIHKVNYADVIVKRVKSSRKFFQLSNS